MTDFDFAYLQIHSHYSGFGGMAEPEEIAAQLQTLTGEGRIAAALTDTFALAGVAEWRAALADSQITPLVGAEIGISFESGHGLPLSLLLLVENEEGYKNLCQLISAGLTVANTNPLTARIYPGKEQNSEGLIAIAPYYGGAITSALRQKASDAKNRAQMLKDIFGADNFFLGVPPIGENDTGKLNSALAKLARELKIELVVTGESRYPRPKDEQGYVTLRNRMAKMLPQQFTPPQLQLQQDWLYSPLPFHINTGLHLRPPAELINYYRQSEWSDGLRVNQVLAARCGAWQPAPYNALEMLRARCQLKLAEYYPNGEAAALLENELADIAELDLAAPLLAAARLFDTKNDPPVGQVVVIARRLSGSLVAFLLGISEFKPGIEVDNQSFDFSELGMGGLLRLEVGRLGRLKLTLHKSIERKVGEPVAMPALEIGALPIMHPRQLIVALPDFAIKEVLPSQMVDNGQEFEFDYGTGKTAIGIMVGKVTPENATKFEIVESSGLVLLQECLDVLNWCIKEEENAVKFEDLPLPSINKIEDSNIYERALVKTRLEYVKKFYPAAYYAAALTLADKAKRAQIAQAVRLAGIDLLPPNIQSFAVDFDISSQTVIRVGLGAVLNRELASRQQKKLFNSDVENLDVFLEETDLLEFTKEDLEKLAWSGALDVFGARESLVEAIPAMLAAQAAYRAHYEAGQNAATDTKPKADAQRTLFDLFEENTVEPVAVILPEVTPVVLPEVPPLSPLARLQKQREVLGFDTSAHPLWKMNTTSDTDKSPSEAVPLAEALTTEIQGNTPLIVAGMIIGLRRLPMTQADGQGQELTVVRLEDWSGQAELLLPPTVTANNVPLIEGAVLSALVRRLADVKAEGGAVLLAEALSSYPPQPGELILSDDEAADFALAGDDTPEMPAAPSSPLSNDEGWATSLFADLGATEGTPPAAVPSTSIAQQAAAKGKTGNSKPAPPRQTKVHINLPATEDEAQEEAMLQRLMEVLRQYPGELTVNLYLPNPTGGYLHFEPQTVAITYSPEFVTAVAVIVGSSDKIRIE